MDPLSSTFLDKSNIPNLILIIIIIAHAIIRVKLIIQLLLLDDLLCMLKIKFPTYSFLDLKHFDCLVLNSVDDESWALGKTTRFLSCDILFANSNGKNNLYNKGIFLLLQIQKY